MKHVQFGWSFSDPFKSIATVLYVYILIQKLAPTYTKTYTLQNTVSSNIKCNFFLSTYNVTMLIALVLIVLLKKTSTVCH